MEKAITDFIYTISTIKRLTVQNPDKVRELYYELIMTVENKYPNESRHETALRYIKEAENKKLNEECSKKENNKDWELELI